MSAGPAREHTTTEAYLDEIIKFFETARDENNEEYEVWLWWKDDRKYYLEEGRLFRDCDKKAEGYLKDHFYLTSPETHKADKIFLKEKESEYLYFTADKDLTHKGICEKHLIYCKVQTELKKYLISTYNDLLAEIKSDEL
jgi:hypothetical protein